MRLPLFVFQLGLPKASSEIRREVFFFVSDCEQLHIQGAPLQRRQADNASKCGGEKAQDNARQNSNGENI